MKYCFGDIVVVEGNLIGVIVKSWVGETINHDVYVRYFNEIRNYNEEVIQRYMVRHKYLSEEEIMYQDNAVRSKPDYQEGKLDLKQVEILMMEVGTLLRKYSCPEDMVEGISKTLGAIGVTRTADLLCLSPRELWSIEAITPMEHGILVATILSISRDVGIQLKYKYEEYYETLKSKPKKKGENKND